MEKKGNTKKKSSPKKTGAKKPSATKSVTEKKKKTKNKKPEIKKTAAPKAETKKPANAKKENGFVSRLSNWIKGKNTVFKTLLFIFLAALVCYAVYQIVKCDSGAITTETAQKITIADVIATEGYTVRDETVIMSTETGVMVPTVENGGKISKGEAIANVFSSEQAAAAYERINEIDNLIDEFESMSTASEDSSLESSLETQISSRLIDLSKAMNEGNLAEAQTIRSELLYLMNKKQVATKEVDGFDQRITELKAERDSLSAQFPAAPGKVTSPLSGYYFDKADGYETLLNTTMLETMTPEALDNVKVQHQSVVVSSNVVGKLADDYRWHIVCEVSADQAQNLKLSGWYDIILPYSEMGRISAKLMYINPGADAERVMLVFRCITAVPDISSVRVQPIEIEVKSATGLGINTAAIVSGTDVRTVSDSDGNEYQEEYDVPGVYVLWGNEIKFRKIDIIYTVGDSAVCREKSESGWLKMYDKVILDPEGMYNGKIVRGY